MGFWTKDGIGAIIMLIAILIVRFTDYLPGVAGWVVAIAGIMYIICYVKRCYDQVQANPELMGMIMSKVNGGK